MKQESFEVKIKKLEEVVNSLEKGETSLEDSLKIFEDGMKIAKDCNKRIARENGKIEGADYMLQRFLDILRSEVDPQESEVRDEGCD